MNSSQPALSQRVELPASSFEYIDSELNRLSQKKDEWVTRSPKERIAFLQACRKGVIAIAEEWSRASNKAKGFQDTDNLSGEEWMSGIAAVLRYITMTIEALRAGGKPRPRKVYKRENGQYVAQVYPRNLSEKFFLQNTTAEVWIEPGQEPSQGHVYRNKDGKGKIALVLGAGNQSSIPLLDTLYKLIAENEVVLLKMNPVNEYLGPLFERAFEKLIKAGYFAVIYGGAEVGQYACHHRLVDSVHITGSVYSHDAIVWGATKDEQEERKKKNDPKLKKPITSELGCVTPVIVVPGQWSNEDLDLQAQNLTSMVANNGSYNCASLKVIITAKDWPQREAFFSKLREHFSKHPARKAYYPGSFERHQAFLKKYPSAKVLSTNYENAVPWTLIPNVPPVQNEYALSVESFCGVFCEVSLDEYDVPEYLERAVEFANDNIAGTLSCGIVIDAQTEAKYSKELDAAIANLRYGGVAINAWPALLYWLMSTTWGAFPGHPLSNVQSGRGVVHNTYLFDHPQKSVVRAPFRVWPKPPWFVTHKNLLETARQVAYFEGEPSLVRFVKVVAAALKG